MSEVHTKTKKAEIQTTVKIYLFHIKLVDMNVQTNHWLYTNSLFFFLFHVSWEDFSNLLICCKQLALSVPKALITTSKFNSAQPPQTHKFKSLVSHPLRMCSGVPILFCPLLSGPYARKTLKIFTSTSHITSIGLKEAFFLSLFHIYPVLLPQTTTILIYTL